MIEYCISLFQKEQEEKLYKNYLAECARITTENTAKLVSLLTKDDNVKYIGISYSDMITPKQPETRTSEEVIDAIGKKLQKIGGETE